MSSAETANVVESAFDVQRIRQDFPILSRSIREKKLVYLENAATTQKPQPVLDTLARYYATGNANIHRGVYLLSEEATAAYDLAREKVQGLLNARAHHAHGAPFQHRSVAAVMQAGRRPTLCGAH